MLFIFFVICIYIKSSLLTQFLPLLISVLKSRAKVLILYQKAGRGELTLPQTANNQKKKGIHCHQSKMTMKYHLTPISMEYTRGKDWENPTKCCQSFAKNGAHFHSWGNAIWLGLQKLFTKIRIELFYDPVVPLLSTYLSNTIAIMKRRIPPFSYSCSSNIQDMEADQVLTIDQWIKELWH